MPWETKKGYICTECDVKQVPGEFDEEPLYECGECGTKFNRANSANDNHQCPDCRKFASKVQDATGIACPECEAGELDEFTGIECARCGDGGGQIVIVPEDDIMEHLKEEHADDLANYYYDHEVK